MHVKYEYHATEGRTTAVLTREDGRGAIGVGITPLGVAGDEFCIAIASHDAISGQGSLVPLTLNEFDLDELIAELQRMRSGCFNGQYPRPETSEPTVSAVEIVNWVMANCEPGDLLSGSLYVLTD